MADVETTTDQEFMGHETSRGARGRESRWGAWNGTREEYLASMERYSPTLVGRRGDYSGWQDGPGMGPTSSEYVHYRETQQSQASQD